MQPSAPQPTRQTLQKLPANPQRSESGRSRALAIARRSFRSQVPRAAAIYSLVQTCRLNDVDPQAWLADVLARLPDHPAKRIGELTPWAWKARLAAEAALANKAAA